MNKPLDPISEKYKHPLGGYSPEELGIDLPGINRIFLDECGGDKPLHYQTVTWASAHTHACQLDPAYKSICLIRSHLRNSDGTLSNIFWHEYGHVITKPKFLLKHTKVSGVDVHEFTVNTNEVNKKYYIEGETYYRGIVGESIYQDGEHGEDWEAAMRSLDKAHLISRFAEPPY